MDSGFRNMIAAAVAATEFSMANDLDVTIWTNADMIDIRQHPFALKIEAEKVDIKDYSSSRRNYHCIRMPICEITPKRGDNKTWWEESKDEDVWKVKDSWERKEALAGIGSDEVDMHFGLSPGTQCLNIKDLKEWELNFTKVAELNKSPAFIEMGIQIFIFMLQGSAFNSNTVVAKALLSNKALKEPEFDRAREALQDSLVGESVKFPVSAPRGGHFMFPPFVWRDVPNTGLKVEDPITSLASSMNTLELGMPFYYGIRVKKDLVTKKTRQSLASMLEGAGVLPTQIKRKPSGRRSKKYEGTRVWEKAGANE